MVVANAHLIVQSGTFPTTETDRTEHRFKYGFVLTLDETIRIYTSKEAAQEAMDSLPEFEFGYEIVPLSVAIQYIADSAYCIK